MEAISQSLPWLGLPSNLPLPSFPDRQTTLPGRAFLPDS